jgi:biopolymer transport protein ExbB
MADFAKFYVQGDVWMHPIALCSAVALSMVLERFYKLYFRYNINANHFMGQVQKLVLSNNIDRAIKLCNAAPAACLPRVIKAALTRANTPQEDIANALEEATLEVLPELNRRTGSLPNVANLATLLGLLGTVVGLIQAFGAVAAAPPDQKSQMLTQALAVGLNTTAFGLMVAIPTLAMYGVLNATTKKIVDDIDHFSVKLQNLLIARSKAPAAKAG